MGKLVHSIFVLLGFLYCVVLVVQTQGQSGFISIDCGLPENEGYTEKSTGINYISDVKFIETGISKSVSAEYKISHQQQFSYLRSFPSGVRNCYRITVISESRYLIRASFLYGNYDGLNQPPKFDVHLGANLWDTVKLSNESESIKIIEAIHDPTQDYVHLCLVNTQNGTPFISAVELRTLSNDTYATQPGDSLACFLRLYFHSITNFTYRYKDDLYDRIWEPYSNKNHYWTELNSTMLVDNDLIQNQYKVPAVVMSTGVTPMNGSSVFDFYWDANDDDSVNNDQYYFYLHFTELQKLAKNETRVFNITLNGNFWYGSVEPSYHRTNTIFSRSGWVGYKRNKISLVQTELSTLPPIISAIEIYSVKDFSQVETQKDDVDAITIIKSAYRVTKNWQGDPCLPLAYRWEGLDCSVDGTPRITSLNLSSSGLTGHIIPSIAELTMLESLDLSNNGLSGEIPTFLTQLQSLKVLNLENNNLTGLVPNELVQRSNDGLLSLSMGHQNPNLCESATCNPQKNDTSKKNNNNVAILIVASIAGTSVLVILVIATIAIIYALKMRKQQAAVNNHVEHNIRQNESELESKQRQYSFNELVKITNNFDRIIGRGGFGTVYHGFIDDIQVAVKMLSASSVQGYQQFLAEVKLLMRVHHRNLTSLIGYCNEEKRIGLIYEFMANGNLDEHLSGNNSRAKFFNWEDRLQIALDAAQGLEYLHNGCKPPIIHRDVKCTNILLNENFQAKLADLGLSKSFPTDSGTHVSTIVAGTPGYLDPEYQVSNKLTEKSDVYSFGVVLLKIITGQPALLKTHDNKTHISHWVGSMLSKGDIKSIVDSILQDDYETSSAWRAIETAMACVSINSSKRPHMSDVVSELKECLAIELARKYSVCHIENNDSVVVVTRNLNTESGPLAR